MLAIDLFCGLGGWTEGLLSEGWDVIGFDVERHQYDDMSYPAQLVLQDVLTLHGSQFKDVDLIVASPPCQKYSYMAMPWKRAKKRRQHYLDHPEKIGSELNMLFNACFRIQREACEASGRHIPMIVENVRGAQEWVGRSRWNFGAFHFWGDVPALMPIPQPLESIKNTGQNWSKFKETGEVSPHWNISGIKSPGFDKYAKDGKPTSRITTGAHERGVKQGGDWFNDKESVMRNSSSKSPQRKKASAMIAKIPFTLSQHIARVFKPI